MEVWWWQLILLVQVTLSVCASEASHSSRDVVVALNSFRPISQTSDKFLGISISPKQIFSNDFSVSTINMLQALSPGYLRVGGPESEDLSFNSLNSSTAVLLTERQWMRVNQLAADTGLHLIFSLSTRSPHHPQSELLRFSDNKSYPVTWQLGCCQPIHNNRSELFEESTRKVSSLHRLIDSFPRYQNTAVLSPDLELCGDAECLKALKDFIQETSDDIDFYILKMSPQENIKSMRKTFEQLEKNVNEIENLAFTEDILKPTKISMKKQFWLAEAEDSSYSDKMAEVMSCAVYLGLSGQLGYQTSLLQLSQLSQPSPSYWVALLYRTLVGQAVLGTRAWPQSADLAVFAACTETKPNPVVSTEWQYNAPAVTLWGANPVNQTTHVHLRTSWRVTHAHLYVLTDNDNGSMLLNGQPLRLVHGVLPKLKPLVRAMPQSRSMSMTLPPRSVFFIVLPDAQAPACLRDLGDDNISPLVLNSPIAPAGRPFTSWQNVVKLNDIFIEKGGIFESEEEILKYPGTEIKSNTTEAAKTFSISENPVANQENIKIKEGGDLNIDNSKYSKQPQNNAPYAISNKDIISSNLERTSSNEEPLRHDYFTPSAVVDNHEEYEIEKIDGSNFSSKNLPGKHESSQNTHHTLEANIPRVKRAHNFEQYREIDTETSPLYRRVNMVRRILHKLQQSKQKGRIEENNLWDSSSTTETANRNNYLEGSLQLKEIHGGPISPLASHIKTNNIFKDQVTTTEKSINDGNINYLPGEFYEVLGGLKTDSNILLKDKEDTVIDTSDPSLQNLEPQNCNEEKSKLRISRKPENNPQEDKKIVESATENAKKYYIMKNNSVERNIIKDQKDDLESNSMYKRVKLIPTLSEEHIPLGTNDQTKPYQEEYDTDFGKEAKDDVYPEVKFSAERTKRETDNANKLQKHKEELNETNSISDYSNEVELQQFLKELTDEGEQLLQTIDEDYESDLKHSAQIAHPKQIKSTEPAPVLYTDETTSQNFQGGNKIEELDPYLKNNIVIDKDVKPKITYPSTSAMTNGYGGNKNILGTTIETDFESFESHRDYSPKNYPSTLGELVRTKGSYGSSSKVNIPDKSTTEAISNSDMFIDGITLNIYNTTKPDVGDTSKSTNINYGTNLTNGESVELESENGKGENKVINQSGLELDVDKSSDNSKLDGIQKENIKDKIITRIITKTTPTISTTEKNILREKVDFIDLSNFKITDHLVSNQTYNESKLDGDKSKDEFTGLQNNHSTFVKNPESESVRIGDILKTYEANNYDDIKRKINSESKRENKILPPPLKSTLILRPLSVIPTLKRNLTLPKKINDITNKTSLLNSHQRKSSGTLLGISSLSSLEKSRQERLEAIKLRLQKARERLLNLTIPRTTQNPLPKISQKEKREITTNMKVMTNNLANELKKTKSDDQLDKSIANNKKQADLENFHLIHRLRRQAYDSEEFESSLSMENNFYKAGSIEDEGLLSPKKQPSINIITPYYFPEIKKWIIPLSNKTGNVVYKSKLFPVHFYGIVSDEWAKENMGATPQTKRRRRALSYSCVKDRFNDFDIEDETVKLPQGSRSNAPSLTSPISTPLRGSFSAKQYPIRSKRASNRDIELNEIEMKALLTNEIVKEKPTDDVDQENVFSSMLQKTVSNTVKNKTGIDKMLALAKQYHETNPTSLEIFPQKRKQTKNKRVFKSSQKQDQEDESSNENAAVEIIDDINADTNVVINHPIQSVDNKKDYSSEVFRKNYIEANSTAKHAGTNITGQSTDSEKEDEKTSVDPWSFFINTIQDFFDSATSLF